MLVRTLGLYLNYLIYKIRLYKKVVFNGFTIIYAFKGSTITIGTDVTFSSSAISNLVGMYQRMIVIARYGGSINIGNNCGISGSTIYSMKKINIGNNVLIGANCKVIDNDFHPLSALKRQHQKPEDIKCRPIIIGDDCFIGMNSIILKGTVLGKNCVVGAGSVVSGTWPDNSIIAGNPAKLVRINEV